MTPETLTKQFENPSNSFRMLPLFIIADEVDREEVRRQVRSLKETGHWGLFTYIQRFENGAPEKFLSPWWWKIVDWLAEDCVAYDLDFWVYDEEDWPSGSIGGQIGDEHPELIWKYLHAEDHRLSDAVPTAIEVGAGTLVSAVMYSKKDGVLDPASLVDVTDKVAEGKLTIGPIPGDAWCGVYTARPGRGVYVNGYPDLMDKRATSMFVDRVYGGHYDRVKDVKGLNFVGYFTDEPCISHSMMPKEGHEWYPSLPWTPELATEFKKRRGEDLRGRIPLLYHDAGAESLKLRCRYFETCCDLYHENYFGTIYDFCEERGVKASGHLVVEEDFVYHLALQGGNIVRHYRKMHMPGIDWIHPFTQFEHLPSTTPKYATSMAHLMGRERTWCESFAAAGWGVTFQQVRALVNWEHVNGINMQIPISYRFSLRKPEQVKFYPPGVTYQQPYWDHIEAFADYEARICLLTAGGGHVAQVALAYPEVDITANCWDHDLLRARSSEYNNLGDAIRAAGYDYDIFDDEALFDLAKVEGGKLKTKYEQFDVLVLPHADVVRRSLVAKCAEFAASGGSVIFTGALPKHSYESGTDDPELRKQLSDLFGAAALGDADAGKACVARHGKGSVAFAGGHDEAIAKLRGFVKPDVEYPADEVRLFAYHRTTPEGQLYLVFNYTAERRDVPSTFSASGYPEFWNPETGKIEGLHRYSSTPAGTRVELTFEPYELKPIMLTATPRSGNLARVGVTTLQEVAIAGPFRFSAEDITTRPELAWNFPEMPWPTDVKSIDVPSTISGGDWRGQGLEFFSGIGHYETEVEVPKIEEGARAILDLGKVAVSAKVEVNGVTAGTSVFEPHRVDITDFVRPGKNTLKISVANTLSNYFSRFPELKDAPLAKGGDSDARRVSGLLGPVVLRVVKLEEKAVS